MARNALILSVFLAALSMWSASCGQNAPDGTGNDLIIVVPDARDAEPADVAGSDTAARDTITVG
ncbi:MAG: hypothetical protein WCG96_11420, partial [Actinomycetes bacterium]